MAILICFVIYYGFDGLSTLFSEGGRSLFISDLGMKAHYENISQGILDSRDLVYFGSLTVFFLYLTTVRINQLRR